MSNSKINISEISKKHLDSFRGKNDNFTKQDKRIFVLTPIVISLLLGLWEIPKTTIKENIAICISVLIGLLLNLLVLLLSSLSAKGTNFSKRNKQARLELLEETYYNVSFTTILCIVTLIILFLSEIKMNDYIVSQIGLITIEWIKLVTSYLLGMILYFMTIQIFLHLFMVLKRINKIFSSDIKYFKEL